MRHTAIALIGPLALFTGLFATPAHAAVPQSSERHCSITVVGQKPSGELMTTPETCTTGLRAVGRRATLSTIAVHYTNANYGGSSLSILGTTCGGGWLNLPADWINVISSTSSSCTVDHYDFYYLGGDVETIGGSGNLFWLNDRTNSALYR